MEEDILLQPNNEGNETDGEISATKVNLKLQQFEGPFDLLLSLIEKQKIEIFDVSLSQITDQYLAVIFQGNSFNAEIASEFLVIGASLIHMKTRKLLPKTEEDEEEELTEEDLKARLAVYKVYKEAAESMQKRMELWENALTRDQEVIEFAKKEEEITLNMDSLVNCYERSKLRFESFRNDNKEKMEVILKIEKVSLRQKIKQVIDVVKSKVKVRFSEIFDKQKNSKPEVVTGFLAVLELDRRDKVSVHQSEPFGEITIERKSDDIGDMTLNLEEYEDEWGDKQ